MQRVERRAPISALHVTVPLGNDVAHRAARVALTEGNAAIHAAAGLCTHLRFTDWFIKLVPVTDAFLDRLSAGCCTTQVDERFRISHGGRSSRLRSPAHRVHPQRVPRSPLRADDPLPDDTRAA